MDLGLMKIFKQSLLVLVLATVGFVMAGCRESEQDRPIFPTKGQYGGKIDQKLTPATVDELRFRGQYQNYN